MKKSDLQDIFNGGSQVIYPGKYSPITCNWGEVLRDIQRNRISTSTPLVNVIESKNHYRVDIAAPGHQKEDFLIHLKKRKVDIVSMKSATKESEPQVYHSHEFNYDCFEYRFLLPEDVDADTINAEYKSGILSLFLAKTSKPEDESVHRIIVY
jgi:HSP20 family protein